MAKKKKGGNKTAKRQQAPKGNAKARVATGALDSHALAWRNLLLDPCGASMVQPCYSGSGTGSFVRLRTLAFVSGSPDTQGILNFQLGSNTAWTFGTSTGGNITFTSRTAIFGGVLDSSSQHMRCVAGCIKVRYLGAEQSRSGQIALMTSPPYHKPSDALGVNVSAVMNVYPMITRFGEVIHEVKFSPTAGDEEFTGPAFVEDKSTLSVAYVGIPAGTLQVEVVAVYELEQPIASSGIGGAVIGSVPAPSINTLNQVMRTLGPATKWAYSHMAAPVIKAAAGYASNLMQSGVATASSTALKYAAVL